MSGLRELYQEVIVDHSKRPRNFRKLEVGALEAKGHNPLCGDQITVYLAMEGSKVKDLGFQGAGCAISVAAASMMTEAVKSKSRDEVEALFHRFHDLVTGVPGAFEKAEELGKLAVFSGVAEFPVRVKCASLPWHTLMNALQGHAREVVSTEDGSESRPGDPDGVLG